MEMSQLIIYMLLKKPCFFQVAKYLLKQPKCCWLKAVPYENCSMNEGQIEILSNSSVSFDIWDN